MSYGTRPITKRDVPRPEGTNVMLEEMEMSLAEMRTLRVPIDWREAVAIIQELAHTINRSGHDAEVPDLDHLLVAIVAPSGIDRRERSHPEVLVRPGSEPPDHPVRQMARLLQELVEGGSPPPQLRLFISQNASQPPLHATVTEFSGGLRFFERPNRQGDVSAVLLRARDLQDDSSARETEEDNAPSRFDRVLEWARAQSPIAVLISLLVAAVLVPAIWFGSSQSSETWLEWQDRAAQTMARAKQITSASVEALGAMFPESAPEVPDDEADALALDLDPDAPATVGAAVRVAPLDPAQGRSSRDVSRPRSPSVAANAPLTLVASQTPGEAAAEVDIFVSESDSETLYSSADPDVAPPSLTLPQMRSATPEDAESAQQSVLHIVVDENDRVETVTLNSPSNLYRDRMLVSAAKAWRFTPAVRDGRPVKYRLRLPITP